MLVQLTTLLGQADRYARGQMFFYLGIGLFVLAFAVIIIGVVMQIKKSRSLNQEIEQANMDDSASESESDPDQSE